ncbi:bifunctional DNA primase/polymerase [Mycolicibacterium baixiangningiae]|uniref:bifunctional DNA primase/polymerase n=1 Tax=Mycolicibacterium baixiangningiae TaxID=2761578 RepID=UPI001865EA75|nr:bifunctional DNA primase/polymerase [Mycolicibacterium baixiangningiae]
MSSTNEVAPATTGGGNPLGIMLEHGFSVGPLAGKIPITAHGVVDFTRDRNVIASWKRKFGECNWGVTQVGVICLDVDPRNGGRVSALNLRPEHSTLCVQTGSGGWHLYYRHSGSVRGKVDGIPGIDIKAGGRGYLVAPGSIHPDTGRPYRLYRDAPIADLPEHLRALIVQPTYAPPARDAVLDKNSTSGDRWEGLVRAVHEAQPGNRNSTLFWAAARAAADSAPAAVYSALAAAAHEIGLGAHEIHQTIQSGQRKAAS